MQTSKSLGQAKNGRAFMKIYVSILLCHSAEMKNKVMKQILNTVIFHCALEYFKRSWTVNPVNHNSRKCVFAAFFFFLLVYCFCFVHSDYCFNCTTFKVRPITCKWIPLFLMPKEISVHYNVPFKDGEYSFILRKASFTLP